MTPDEFRDALDKIEITLRGFGRMMGVNARTVQRWAEEGPSPPAAFALELMLALGLKSHEAQDLIKRLRKAQDAS